MCNKRFSAALVDPSVFRALEYDFAGINSVTLSALFNLFRRKETALLDCNVLHQVVKSKIAQSALIAEFARLRSFCNGLDMLNRMGAEVANAASVLEGVNLQARLEEEFEQAYADAIEMPACSNDVLTLYYAQLPPFNGVSPQFSIADAFILSSFIDYANSHSDERFLVVSGSDDWQRILDGMDNVAVVYSASKVLNTWLPEKELSSQLFKRLKSKILEKAQEVLYKLHYVVANSEEEEKPTLDVNDRVCIYNHYVSSLMVTDCRAVYDLTVDLDVDGYYKRGCCVYDKNRLAYANCADACVSLEVEIAFDETDIAHTARIAKVKATDCGAIPVYLRADD